MKEIEPFSLTKSNAAILRGLSLPLSAGLSYLHTMSELLMVVQVVLLGSFSEVGLKKLATALSDHPGQL